MSFSNHFELLYEKPYIQIGWFTEKKILKVTFLKNYSLYEATDITIELLGLLISKQISSLILHIGIPLEISEDVRQYTIKETFPLFEVYGIKKIAYLHFDGLSFEPLALIKKNFNLSKMKVKVFEGETDALNWLINK